MSETFVTMYHPALGNRQVRVSLSSVDDHALHGWLLVDPGVTPPAPVTPYITQAAADSRYLGRTDVLDVNGKVLDASLPTRLSDTALRAASVAAVATRPAQQQVETVNSAALRHFRLALGDRDANPCDLLHLGDSIDWGYGVSAFSKRWPSATLARLRTHYPTAGVAGGLGYIIPRVHTPHLDAANLWPDNPVTATSGGTQATPSFGLAYQARAFTATGNSITFVFTGTGIDIDYAQYASANSFTVTVDGGAPATVNSTGAVSPGLPIAGRTYQVRGLTAGSHTVVVAWASGSPFISGAFAYNGDEAKGIRSSIAAIPSWGTLNFWPADTTKRYMPEYVGLRPPDLVTIGFGPNDYGSSDSTVRTTPAIYKANIQGMIAAIKSKVTGYVPSFVLTPKWQLTGTNPLAPWADFRNAMYEIAAADPDRSVAVFDLAPRVNDDVPSTAGGILPDTIHPGDPGSRFIGELFADWLATA